MGTRKDIIQLSESLCSDDGYQRCIDYAEQEPDLFWSAIAQHYLSWHKLFTSARSQTGSQEGDRWFADGKVNISDNCIDRHIINGYGEQNALICESEEAGKQVITYRQLLSIVSKTAWALRKSGIGRDDVVAIYMPMKPEAIITLLAANRIGAVPCPLYAGISGSALAARLRDSGAKLLVCAENTIRGGKSIDIRGKVADALMLIENDIDVVEVSLNGCSHKGTRDWISWNEWVQQESEYYPLEYFAGDAPAFMIYTSGTSGKPKRVVHQSGGALLACHMTTRWCFDSRRGDVIWSTSDFGWIASMSHVIYGPLSNCLSSVIFEGSIVSAQRNNPWHIIQEHKVRKWKTAPTAIRSLMRDEAKKWLNYDLSSLDVLFSSGEPLDFRSRQWIEATILNHGGTVIDGWGQTETCSTVISGVPGTTKSFIGSIGRPLPGAHCRVVSGAINNGGSTEGYLQITGPWPGLWSNVVSPSKKQPLATGDVARIEEDGSITIIGRHDDVVNVSGHRISTKEVEDAARKHDDVIDLAAVGRPHELKGQCIALYVVLKKIVKDLTDVEHEIYTKVKETLGGYAAPTDIFVVEELPRTHSGKIAKGYLMKLAAQEHLKEDIDTSMILNNEILAALEEESLHRDNYS